MIYESRTKGTVVVFREETVGPSKHLSAKAEIVKRHKALIQSKIYWIRGNTMQYQAIQCTRIGLVT